MSTFAKVAIAAVVVIAIGAVGLSVLSPRSRSGVGGEPSPSPSPSATPTRTPVPTPSPVTAPPPTESFTSDRHGFSMSYETGWETQPATAPWTTGFPNFKEPSGDFIYDPSLQDHLFISVVSRPLGSDRG